MRIPSKERVRYHAARWAWVVGLALTAYLAFPSSAIDFAPLLEASKVADRDVVAPFTFSVSKTDQELVREAEELASTVKPIYEFQQRALDSARATLRVVFAALDAADQTLGRRAGRRTTVRHHAHVRGSGVPGERQAAAPHRVGAGRPVRPYAGRRRHGAGRAAGGAVVRADHPAPFVGDGGTARAGAVLRAVSRSEFGPPTPTRARWRGTRSTCAWRATSSGRPWCRTSSPPNGAVTSCDAVWTRRSTWSAPASGSSARTRS